MQVYRSAACASSSVCVCMYSITQCCLVGETVRIQADYRAEIQSLHLANPVFYSQKTGGYMSEQDEKVPHFVSYKKSWTVSECSRG